MTSGPMTGICPKLTSAPTSSPSDPGPLSGAFDEYPHIIAIFCANYLTFAVAKHLPEQDP